MTPRKKFKFALVGHSHELADAVRRSVNPESEEVAIRVVNMGESLSVARQLIEEGTEIVFGHMGNAQIMFQEIGLQLVEIPRTHLDMMEAFVRARKHDTRIGLTSFRAPTDGMQFIERVLKIKVHQIIFNTFAEMEQGVYDAHNDGIRVIVGGGVSHKIITSLGGWGIVVKPRQSAVDKAFREARAIASLRRKEAENSAWIKTILQMIDDGVIGVDNFGRINIYNDTAEKILARDLKQALGQSQTGILKDIHLLDVLTSGHPKIDAIKKVGRNNIVVNALPIHINGRPQGAVALLKTVSRIQSINRKLKENLYSKGFMARYNLENLLGRTPAMRQLKANTRQYAGTNLAIMIQGETGTGKEILAQAIHNLSPRRHQPFVAINCAALPESLLESELFGYEEGAFTGAKRGGKTGLLELAGQGTVFLDEIADISTNLQMHLLRVIENKEVMRVGGDRYVPVDVRIISSSYRDLRREIEKGRFRPDLYYRLAVLRLKLPSLIERKADIGLIVEQTVARNGKNKKSITADMIAAMSRYHWPGNVRELISFVESYLILLGQAQCNKTLFYQLLEDQIEDADRMGVCKIDADNRIDRDDPPGERPAVNLKQATAAFERELINDTLKDCYFNKKETARRLGISVNTLWRKMKTC